jgi:hypothetical protein
MKKHVLLSVCLCSLIAPGAMAQSIGPSVLNSAGGSAVIGGNTYEWSAGEMTLVSTFAATGISVTQGILQPMQSTTGIAQLAIGNDELRVFPVPATDVLYIRPSFMAGGALSISLLDAAGRALVRTNTALSAGNEVQQLDMRAYASGNYLLQISYDSKGVLKQQSYKVQKAH